MTATTIIMDIRLTIIVIETPTKDPRRGLSIINDCGREFAIVWCESVDTTKVVVAVEVMVD